MVIGDRGLSTCYQEFDHLMEQLQDLNDEITLDDRFIPF